MYCLAKKRLIKPTSLSTQGVLIACALFSPMALAVCNVNAPATTPSSDFIDHNDGTVTHTTTGLMWKVCSEGQTWTTGACSGGASSHTWDSALQIPQALNSSGGFPSSGGSAPYTNWRLPNLKELKSIVELQCYSPAINETIFPGTANSFYWSSSPSADYSSGAWGVGFGYGDGNYGYRSNSFRVRLVRVGQ